MTKKEYIQPAMMMVKINTQHHILNVSQVSTTGLGDDDLNYTKGTGDMGDAMVKGSNNAWDEEW